MKLNETPIEIKPLPFLNGNGEVTLEGDDWGYDSISMDPEAIENPDPMVLIPKGIKQVIPYATGSVPELCPYYENGIGAFNRALIRKPVIPALTRMQNELRKYDRELVILDALRTPQVTAAMFADIFKGLAANEGHNDLRKLHKENPEKFIEIGSRANKIGSLYPIAGSENLASDIRKCLAMEANLGWNKEAAFDNKANTAHGSGGTLDLWGIDKTTGKFANLGCPFDYKPGPNLANPLPMTFFEDENNIEPYAEAVAKEKYLGDYYESIEGTRNVIQDVFIKIRDERRILCNAARSQSAVFYGDEPWHFSFGNFGGNQSYRLISGGGDFATLHPSIDPITRQYVRVWDNTTAFKSAREVMRKAKGRS